MARPGRTFVFIGNFYEYERVIFEHASKDGKTILVYDPVEMVARFIPPRLVPKPLRSLLLQGITRRLLRRHAQDIIVMHEERVMLGALAGQPVRAHINVRDALLPGSRQAKQLALVRAMQAAGHTVWSFDPGNCERYQFRPCHQFISRIPGMEATPVDADFAFFGQERGRAALLASIQAIAQAQRLTAKIALRPHQRMRLPLPYLEYLKFHCSARCVIDIARENQLGLTLRPLEAMFYQRKLVTNCQLVSDLPFYRPENIIVFKEPGELASRDLVAFVNTPFAEVPDEALAPFTLDHLLDQIAAATPPRHKGRL